MPSKYHTAKRCRNQEINKSRTWSNLLFLQRLGHSGILRAVKLPRVSSDEIVACHVKRNKMQNFLNTARINLIVGNRSKFKTDLYQLHRHTSTRLVRSSATDETQQRKRESNKLILVLSSLRIQATCALIPVEDIKNKCVPFPVFKFMMLRSSLNLQLCLRCE